MNVLLQWGLAAVGGCVLGALFFGGLYWTIAKALPSRRPALWFLVSLFLRTAVVLGGFLWIARSGEEIVWQRLVAGLLGFTLARFLVTFWAPEAGPGGEASG